MIDVLCDTCGIGYYLPSGVCDHCNQRAAQPTAEVEPSCDVVELEKAIKELTDLANNGTIGEFHEDNLKMLLGAFKIQSGRKPADSKIRELQALSEPLIEWLNDNFNPHVHIVIEPTGAQLYEGVIGIINHKFLKD